MTHQFQVTLQGHDGNEPGVCMNECDMFISAVSSHAKCTLCGEVAWRWLIKSIKDTGNKYVTKECSRDESFRVGKECEDGKMPDVDKSICKGGV